MRKIVAFLFLFNLLAGHAQTKADSTYMRIRQELNEAIDMLADNYCYLNEKKVSIDCLREKYNAKVTDIKSEEDYVLLFEYLLDEFYDDHLILNTNRNSSYRLFSPLHVNFEKGQPYISELWFTQIEENKTDIIGAEVLKINGIPFNQAIADFPTVCQDKNDPDVREWVANRVVAGRYNEPRVLTLKTKKGKTLELDVDGLKIKQHDQLLSAYKKDDIAVIRINNSLGNDDLIAAFDSTLNQLMDTKGLVLDLRNTVDGGNTYVARGIMSRFITEPKPYQQHTVTEKYGDAPAVEHMWIEYTNPRGETYMAPVVVLVGRWTGSMGEGTAIGFEGMGRGEVIGTEMRRLPGEIDVVSVNDGYFSLRIPFVKLYHLNGTPREKYVPTHYVKQTTSQQDEALEKAFKLLKKAAKKRR